MANQDGQDSASLEALLDLDATTYEVGGGFWVSISVSRVAPDAGRPHGIQYALSLHSPGGRRILGYDNAHPARTRSGPARRSATPAAFDYVHKGARVLSYQFRTPGDLLVDFWNDVEAILRKEGVP